MTLTTCVQTKAVWGARKAASLLLMLSLGIGLPVEAAGSRGSVGKAFPGVPNSHVKAYKLDGELTKRARDGSAIETTSVIVTLTPGAEVPAQFRKYMRGKKLDIISGQVLEVPNTVLKKLEASPEILRIHYNRPMNTHNYRTSVTVGARTVFHTLGYTGAGIGVAVIDSGISSWHDDLTGGSGLSFPYGNQRVTKFVDFVNGRTLPYDDNGHGTHVAGTIAGNGYDSNGEKAGIAPGAQLVALKVLDDQGTGTIANVIAALNWVAKNHLGHNIRVVNMSVGAGVYESYWTDPLTLAAKAVTDRGITVVAAAGNQGKTASGQLQYGAISAPGNAPWVLTVGASSTMGTLTRHDDTMAGYSSAGPTYIDFAAKPDLVAPGTATASLAVPGSTSYFAKSQFLLDGKPTIGLKPYLTLSGTSMAAPVVSGTIALMLQANPSLTPNLIKAILQYTAQTHPDYEALRQGAGFLNTLGAVRLAKFYTTAQPGSRLPVQQTWSRQIIWGNNRITGGYMNPLGNAWANDVIWGSARTLGDDGDNIVWGTECADAGCDNIVWGTHDEADNIVWGTGDDGDNIVWGTSDEGDNIVWGTSFDGDNIVWGTGDDSDNIVWGTDCGGADCDNIVWGVSDDGDNIVWGTADSGDNVVWGTSFDGDNIVWGTSSVDEVAFSDDADLEPLPDPVDEFGDIVTPNSYAASESTDSTGGF